MDWNWYPDKHDSESDDVYIENWYQNHEVSDYSADKHFTLYIRAPLCDRLFCCFVQS